MLAMDQKQVGHQDANPITQMIWANTLLTAFLAVPSLSVMVLLRRKIGYRTLQPWMLLVAFVVLLVLCGGFSMLGGGPRLFAHTPRQQQTAYLPSSDQTTETRPYFMLVQYSPSVEEMTPEQKAAGCETKTTQGKHNGDSYLITITCPNAPSGPEFTQSKCRLQSFYGAPPVYDGLLMPI